MRPSLAPSRQFSASSFRQAAAAAAAQEASPDADAAVAAPVAAPGSRSMCAKGTVLTGINYFKGKQDPVAKADVDYPEWLWSCLDVKKKASSDADADAGDEFCT